MCESEIQDTREPMKEKKKKGSKSSPGKKRIGKKTWAIRNSDKEMLANIFEYKISKGTTAPWERGKALLEIPDLDAGIHSRPSAGRPLLSMGMLG